MGTSDDRCSVTARAYLKSGVGALVAPYLPRPQLQSLSARIWVLHFLRLPTPFLVEDDDRCHYSEHTSKQCRSMEADVLFLSTIIKLELSRFWCLLRSFLVFLDLPVPTSFSNIVFFHV